MRVPGPNVWAIAWGLLLLNFAVADEPALPPAVERRIDFHQDVQPILARHCLSCHGPDQQESNLRLDRRSSLLAGGDRGEPAIVPGHSAESLLIHAVARTADDLQMPPEGEFLSAEEVGILRAWIDQDLPGLEADDTSSIPTTDHWSFQPIVRPPVPEAKGRPWREWSNNPIDAFVLQRLEQAGITPSPQADGRSLLRRLHLDVLGLVPTPEAIDAFLGDTRPDAYDRAVDSVLANPHYGERWGRHWLDVVRFAETNGFETNTPRPNAYHYRDYVIRAWNEDKRYDQFILDQLAGDAVGVDPATGFLVAGPYDTVKSPDMQLTLMQRQDELADMINVTGGTFLGLTIACARCHNHKFDPIRQSDFYSLQAVFAGVQHGDRPLLNEQTRAQEEEASRWRARLEAIQTELNPLQSEQPSINAQRTLLIDDEDTTSEPFVELLATPAGHGENPSGSGRGYRDDPGDFQRLPNISQGRYTWWQAEPHTALAAYRPRVNGEYGVWISWGCGWHTHAADAEYWLDADGDLTTTTDQQLLARVDQRRFADHSETPDGVPLWSGLHWTGLRQFSDATCIVLRSGTQAAAVTTDAVVLAPVTDHPLGSSSALPPLDGQVNAKKNVEQFAPVRARFIRFAITATNQGEPCIDEFEVYADAESKLNLASASCGAKVTSSGDYPGNPKHRLEHIHDGRYGNSYSWISNQPGTGWVQFELPEVVEFSRIVWARDRTGEFTDRLATRYTIEVAEHEGQWQRVASSYQHVPANAPAGTPLAYRFSTLTPAEQTRVGELLAEAAQLDAKIKQLTTNRPLVYGGVFQQPEATHRLYRGDPLQKREAVLPDALPVISSMSLPADTPEQQRRVALARWMTAAENPLTARVIVNRLWHYHFGVGIVATPSDFGANGAQPTHPELLDWLASELISHDWSIKHIQRLILTSSTYQQSAAWRAEAARVDAQARLLWRFPSRRLEAEAIRDNILSVAGVIDYGMYGPGYDVFQPNDNYVRVYTPKETLGPGEWRRMVYMYKVRMEHDPVFGAFDCPDAGQSAPVRPRSTTAIQALNLFNSQFVQQHAVELAELVRREAGDDLRAQIHRAFRRVLGRAPDDSELPTCLEVAQTHGVEAVCRALLNCNEFLFLP